MNRVIVRALACAIFALSPLVAAAAPSDVRPGLAHDLLQGCLEKPTDAGMSRLAAAVGAQPYSEARRAGQMGKPETVISPERSTGRSQRTTTTVTGFRGWDLSGPGAGSMEYLEEKSRTDWIDSSSGQAVTPVRNTLGRTCRLHAPVASGRAMFELLESMTDHEYGIRISPDRRWIDVFMFDEDRYDIELNLVLDSPLADLAADDEKTGESRLVLTDGGPRFADGVAPDYPTVKMTRAALLAALDRPADMTFFNATIEMVVQRLAELGSPR